MRIDRNLGGKGTKWEGKRRLIYLSKSISVSKSVMEESEILQHVRDIM